MAKWTLKSLCDCVNSVSAEIDGQWVPARPLRCDSLWTRLKWAWEVLAGQAESFVWPKGQ